VAIESDAVWITEAHTYTLPEALTLSGLAETELRELVEFGVLKPTEQESTQWLFSGQSLLIMRTASRIRSSFDLEPHGVALVVSLLEQIHGLERQLERLRARGVPQAR
jgi:chaperone modulatory protein CbpM